VQNLRAIHPGTKEKLGLRFLPGPEILRLLFHLPESKEKAHEQSGEMPSLRQVVLLGILAA